MAAQVEENVQIIHGVCPHDCPDTCSFHVTVRDGVAVEIKGDARHPVTRGFLCVKVNNYLERTYNETRILTPRRRVGPKGLGLFEEITWDEALDEIAARFKAIVATDGPEAILPYNYSGTLGKLHNESMDYRFFNRLGASELDRTICSVAGGEAILHTLGAKTGTDPETYVHSKLIVVWGSNPVSTNPHLMPFIKQARHRGAQMVVIDPRRTRTAAQADWHIQPQPGTDAALALGVMHILIAEGLTDPAYIAAHTHGYDALKERAMAYPPARVAAITGLAEDEIVRFARMYGTTAPAVIRVNYGMQRHSNGGMMIRTVACLPALTGSYGTLGGGLTLSTSGGPKLNDAALRRPDLRATPARHVNMIAIGDALTGDLDPPIRVMYVYNANPAAAAPDQQRVRDGLLRDDLFLVVHDPFFSDTTRYADIVLPATTQLEQMDLHTAYGTYYLSLNQPAVAPLGQSVCNTEVFRLLAARMDFAEPCFRDTDEDLIDQALVSDHPHMRGITRARLMAEGFVRLNVSAPGTPYTSYADGIFPTPSGKIEFYSEALAALGLDPLPTHTPLAESADGSPDLHAKYPLALLTPSTHHFLNTTFGNVPSLIHKEGTPFIELNTADAAARGIAHGETVRVFNDRGETFLMAVVGAATKPGVAVAPAIWWDGQHKKRSGINALTSQRTSDMGGGATFYTNLVEVQRTED
jgi:anaerobic selenocysteine-containing dehydrogenase